jgi:hypothetical protein
VKHNLLSIACVKLPCLALNHPVVLALRVAVAIAAGRVASIGNILDIACAERLARDDWNSNASHELIVNMP